MSRLRLLKAAILMLLSAVMLGAQESTPVIFDPETGLPIVKADSVLAEPEAPAGTPETATAYDPITGLPVAAATELLTRPSLNRGPSDLSITGLAINDAKKNHSTAHWMLVGGMANVGAMSVGGLAGGAILAGPGFLIGTVAGVFLVTHAVSRVTDPVAVPVVLKDVPASKQNRYKDSYRLRTQSLRKTSAYLGIVAVGAGLMLTLMLAFSAAGF